MAVTKAQVLEAIRALPDDATVLDALEQVFLLQCADRGVDVAVAWREIQHPQLWCRFADRYERTAKTDGAMSA